MFKVPWKVKLMANIVRINNPLAETAAISVNLDIRNVLEIWIFKEDTQTAEHCRMYRTPNGTRKRRNTVECIGWVYTRGRTRSNGTRRPSLTHANVHSWHTDAVADSRPLLKCKQPFFSINNHQHSTAQHSTAQHSTAHFTNKWVPLTKSMKMYWRSFYPMRFRTNPTSNKCLSFANSGDAPHPGVSKGST